MAPKYKFGAILFCVIAMGICRPISALAASPTLSSLRPSQGASGTLVTIRGAGFTADNVVHFGAGGSQHIPSANDGTSIQYKIPIAIGPCDLKPSPCRDVAARMLLPGVYPISVSNANGQSNTLEFTLLRQGAGRIEIDKPFGFMRLSDVRNSNGLSNAVTFTVLKHR